jgi:hypothetical protein
MISLKIGGIIVAAFIAGAFVASPELRAFAADTVGSADIIDESILSVDIKNGEVKTLDIGTGQVTNTDLGTNSVTATKIATNAVTSAKILDGQVMTADIANGNVTNSKLAADSVDSSKILDEQITSADIRYNGVTDDEIAPDSVGSSELYPNSVGATELQGVTVLGFGYCSIDPPDIGGTDEAGNGRIVITTSLATCPLPAGTTRVIAYPESFLAAGLVPCGSHYVGNPPYLRICLQNVFDTTNVNDIGRQFAWIAFAAG